MSYYGYFAATALCHRMRSGNPASPRFFQATSWNAFERLLVPMPSICTTMKPSSASACVRAHGAERLGDERALRPGVDILDHRILLVRVEIHGPGDGAPDVGLAVAALGDEDFGRLEARGQQRRVVALVEIHDHFLVFGAAQLRDRRQDRRAARYPRNTCVLRETSRVSAVGIGQLSESGAVEIDAAILSEVGILAGNHAARLEPDLALLVVHADRRCAPPSRPW